MQIFSLKTLFSFLAAAALLGPASADTVVESYTLLPQGTGVSRDFSLPQFNPALGTLTGADLSLSGNGTFDGTITNTASVAEKFTFTETLDLSLTSAFLPSASVPGVLTASEAYSLPVGGAAPFSPAVSGFGPNVQSYRPADADFGKFTGNALIPFNLGTVTAAAFKGGGGNEKLVLVTQAGGKATLTYTYIPAVPEASTTVSLGLLLALGLGGLMVKKGRQA